MFLPSLLGWWALKNWTGPQGEPTFSDDIEYLMGKCLGTDAGLALMGIDPDNQNGVPALPRLGAIIRRYEDLRHSGKVPESIKTRLRVPGDEFLLTGSLQEGWQFRPAQYVKHKVESAEPWSSRWKAANKFAAQPLRLRIEALMAAGPYEDPSNPMLADFAAPGDFAQRAAAAGVTADLKPSKDQIKIGAASGCYTATNAGPSRPGSWAKCEKTFAPPQNLDAHQALGLWVYGDGQGEVLNLQLRSPSHLVSGIGDHYITVDFTGWRYFELIEPEGDRYADFRWPYGDIYSIYRESVRFDQVETVGLWYNNLPPGKPATCYLSPIKAMPLVASRLVHPTVTIGAQAITFPVEIPSGHYLELIEAGNCKLYGPTGETLREITPQGTIPTLQPGENEIAFQTQTPAQSQSASSRDRDGLGAADSLIDFFAGNRRPPHLRTFDGRGRSSSRCMAESAGAATVHIEWTDRQRFAMVGGAWSGCRLGVPQSRRSPDEPEHSPGSRAASAVLSTVL